MPDRADGGERRLLAFLTLATAAQVAFWLLATPGPTLVGDAPRGPGTAFAAVAWTAATLGVTAILTAPLLGRSFASLGFGAGRSGRAVPLVLLGILVAAPVLWLAASDPSLRTTYPWTSAEWLRERPGRWAAWAALYAIYYVSYEAFYRGAVLGALTPRLGGAAANVMQASLATLVHVGKPLAETFAAFPASLAFGLLVLRFRSLWPAVVLHLAIGLLTDAAIVLRGAP